MIPTPFGTIAFDQPIYLWLLPLGLVAVGLAVYFGRRTMNRWRWIVATAARTLLLLILVLALAGTTIRLPIDSLGVVFVVDDSASVGTDGRDKAMAFIDSSSVEVVICWPCAAS